MPNMLHEIHSMHSFRSAFVVTTILAAACGCDPSGPMTKPAADAAPELSVADVAQGYKQLRPMTKGAVFVDPTFASLCRGVTRAEYEEAQKNHSGPHALAAVRIYMNDVAAAAFTQASTPYPVGSVVVKEKQTSEGTGGVGGMIKRPHGYDPTHGDWEYFYFENPAKIESGKISSCVQCHAGAATKDYVFGGWAHEDR